MSRTIRRDCGEYRSSDLDTTRDRKKWYKPGRIFKDLKKSRRKAKERMAFRMGKDVPDFPKTDVWDYN